MDTCERVLAYKIFYIYSYLNGYFIYLSLGLDTIQDLYEHKS